MLTGMQQKCLYLPVLYPACVHLIWRLQNSPRGPEMPLVLVCGKGWGLYCGGFQPARTQENLSHDRGWMAEKKVENNSEGDFRGQTAVST